MLRVTSNWFCAGLVIKDETVSRAAPCLKQYLGWNKSKAILDMLIKRWKVEVL